MRQPPVVAFINLTLTWLTDGTTYVEEIGFSHMFEQEGH